MEQLAAPAPPQHTTARHASTASCSTERWGQGGAALRSGDQLDTGAAAIAAAGARGLRGRAQAAGRTLSLGSSNMGRPGAMRGWKMYKSRGAAGERAELPIKRGEDWAAQVACARVLGRGSLKRARGAHRATRTHPAAVRHAASQLLSRADARRDGRRGKPRGVTGASDHRVDWKMACGQRRGAGTGLKALGKATRRHRAVAPSALLASAPESVDKGKEGQKGSATTHGGRRVCLPA